MPALHTTFNAAVNTASINALFSGGRIASVADKPMHPATRRLYEAVQMLSRSDALPQPGRVANEANISPQTLNHWEERGPSAQGLLDFQQATGVNATWVLTGHGPLMVGGSARHRAAEPPAAYHDGTSWPLSVELLRSIAALDSGSRRRIENSIRAQLDMAPLPSAGNRNAA